MTNENDPNNNVKGDFIPESKENIVEGAQCILRQSFRHFFKLSRETQRNSRSSL